MSRTRNYGKPTALATLIAAAIFAAGSPSAAHAQYVGHVDANDDSSAPTLRATAVLEYTGDVTKPTVSRLVPIAVWDGERYQPGGLYLAQPVPLTVQFGTQYLLETAGMPKGFYDIKAASDVGGSWIATGAYQKPDSPKIAHLKQSRTLPRIVNDKDDDKPHFAHVPTGDTNSGSSTAGGTNNAPANTTPVDPDRPTLHRRSSDPSSQGPSSDAGTGTAASNPAPDIDPDRPTLHRTTNSSAPTVASDNGAPVSATNVVDPDRPRLEYGRPKDLEPLDAPSTVEINKLAKASPESLERMVAISDAKTHEPQSYLYSWLDPEDEKKALTALETIAQQMLAQNETIAVTNNHPASKTTTATHRTASAKKSVKSSSLTDETFKAYQLSFGSGATLVFQATSGEGDAARYVTLIAQPDFNGTPIVLFKQVATQREIDITPRMKLVDAVDTDGDNRAELIFALENETGRQYAIYRVANNTVEKVFSTGS